MTGHTPSSGPRRWGGKLVGKGEWPLGHQADCRMWLASEFGPAVYTAKGYVIIVEPLNASREVQIDPGARYFRRFIKVLEQAREYSMRRGD